MRRLVRTLLLGLAGTTAMAAAGDQPAPPPMPNPTPPATSSPATPAPPEGDIEDFVPSEKVGAEDAVAFPVDI